VVKSYANGAAAAFAIVGLFVCFVMKINGWVYYVVVFVFDLKVLGVSAAASVLKATLSFGKDFAIPRLAVNGRQA
jgi:hypothetical protein